MSLGEIGLPKCFNVSVLVESKDLNQHLLLKKPNEQNEQSNRPLAISL